MVKMGPMGKSNLVSFSRRRAKAAERAQFLAAFDRSGLCAADFARQHGLNYTTFCGWRQRRDKAKGVVGFVEVELAGASAPRELMVEMGAQMRMRIADAGQIELAAALIRAIHQTQPC
jgi:hypothetical protein